LRVVVVGHGPSATTLFLAQAIDAFDVVVRMKRAETDPVHRGLRTDYIVTSEYWARVTPHTAPWLAYDEQRWGKYFSQYSSKEPSTGLRAVFCAVERWADVSVVGFDDVFRPPRKKRTSWGHDSAGERAALESLGVKEIAGIH
jgi:hypothetical protein